jgi:hypothetical protein
MQELKCDGWDRRHRILTGCKGLTACTACIVLIHREELEHSPLGLTRADACIGALVLVLVHVHVCNLIHVQYVYLCVCVCVCVCV